MLNRSLCFKFADCKETSSPSSCAPSQIILHLTVMALTYAIRKPGQLERDRPPHRDGMGSETGRLSMGVCTHMIALLMAPLWGCQYNDLQPGRQALAEEFQVEFVAQFSVRLDFQSQ